MSPFIVSEMSKEVELFFCIRHDIRTLFYLDIKHTSDISIPPSVEHHRKVSLTN